MKEKTTEISTLLMHHKPSDAEMKDERPLEESNKTNLELIESNQMYVKQTQEALQKWEEFARSILIYFKMYTQVEHKASNIEIAATKIKDLEKKLEEQKNNVPIITGGKA